VGDEYGSRGENYSIMCVHTVSTHRYTNTELVYIYMYYTHTELVHMVLNIPPWSDHESSMFLAGFSLLFILTGQMTISAGILIKLGGVILTTYIRSKVRIDIVPNEKPVLVYLLCYNMSLTLYGHVYTVSICIFHVITDLSTSCPSNKKSVFRPYYEGGDRGGLTCSRLPPI
jgi:hypothetical protein